MFSFLQNFTLIAVAFAMIPAVAHALEYPGKMRLRRDEYVAVQRIYYPGFTVAGFSEPLALMSTVALLVLSPGPVSFWMTLLALAGLISMQLVYWIRIHPVNKVWLENQPLGDAAAGFFGSGEPLSDDSDRPFDWTDLRRRWERAHVGRAALAVASFITLVIVT